MADSVVAHFVAAADTDICEDPAMIITIIGRGWLRPPTAAVGRRNGAAITAIITTTGRPVRIGASVRTGPSRPGSSIGKR